MRQTSRVITFLTLFALFPTAAQAASYTYVVSAGDTLSKIAREHQTSVQEIMQQNLLDSDRLTIGQTLSLSGTGLPDIGPVATAPDVGNHISDSVDTDPVVDRNEKKAKVVADVLHVRQSPSLTGEILGKLYYGNKVDLIEMGSEWTKIHYDQGEAYVASEYVHVIDPDAEDALESAVVTQLDQLEKLVTPLLGTRYILGGTTPDGFDCSGFTAYVFAKLGVSLPRTSEDQFHGGVSIPLEEAKPGDLLFYDALKKGTVSHVAIYLGNDRIVHANGDDVRFGKLEYMQKLYPFYGVKRYLDFE